MNRKPTTAKLAEWLSKHISLAKTDEFKPPTSAYAFWPQRLYTWATSMCGEWCLPREIGMRLCGDNQCHVSTSTEGRKLSSSVILKWEMDYVDLYFLSDIYQSMCGEWCLPREIGMCLCGYNHCHVSTSTEGRKLSSSVILKWEMDYVDLYFLPNKCYHVIPSSCSKLLVNFQTEIS